MQFQEVVEAQGHLIDSHVMEEIFDKVVEYNSRFEVEQFKIGRTNSDASYLRLKVEAPSQDVMDHLLQQLLGLGCSPVDPGTRICGRWSATAARRRISTRPPTTARSFATGSSGSKWRISAWTRWW